jgi:hypothetical protein
MALDALALADVVQEQDEVEEGGVGGLRGARRGSLSVMGSASVKMRSSSRMALRVWMSAV